ncbi:MAG: SulP family inorganic anion transporter [Bacteroidota bacterium]|nr:SulP family inorganic anion transporter [Bacteroidota bacterium]
MSVFKHIKGDFFGGITAGIVALPLALAFGVSSGLGASAGLYGAIFIGFFAALFGGTNTQISGPTAPMTAISMVIIAGIIASNDGNLAKALPAILGVFLMVGIFQIILGLIGLGKYIKYIPYPVVSGFMTAIGVIIIITQIIPSLGYNPKKDESYVSQFKQHAEAAIVQNILKEEADQNIFVIEDYKQTVQRAEKITSEEIAQESETLAAKESSGVLGSIKILPRALRNIKWIEVLLTCCTIFIIYGFKKITTKIPSALVALIAVSAVAYYAGVNYISIDTIPSGLPLPHLEIFSQFKFSEISPFIFSALSLALLGCIDSLLTSVVADNMTKTRHNPNKELIGQGIGNGVAALFGGIPGAGATIRTVVNINAGGKTRISGIVAAIFIVVILLALGPLASKVPAAVLSGILITVGIGVIDYKGLKAIPAMPRSEIVIMMVVLILSSIWNLVYAVGIGLIIASMMFMKKIGDLTAKDSLVQPLKKETAWEDEFDFPENLKEDVFIKHINGPLFFGSTSDFSILIKQIPTTASAIIIRMDNMSYVDQSGLYALEDTFVDLVEEGKKVLLVCISSQPRYMLERIKIIPDLIPSSQVFTNLKDCLTWINQNVKHKYI